MKGRHRNSLNGLVIVHNTMITFRLFSLQAKEVAMVAAIIKLFKATPTNDLGGYDYEFVDAPPDTLVCKICHCPSKEPHLSVCCGHTFCKSCLVSAKNSTVAKVCPMCRSENFETFPNKQNERLIKSLAVFCTNKGKGCDWQGEVGMI